MKRFLFFLFSLSVIAFPAFSQLGVFTQRGRATQEMTTEGLCAAHNNIPLNSTVTITNTINGKTIDVSITGRILMSSQRIIDLSFDAWSELGLNEDTIVALTYTPVLPAIEPAPDIAAITADATAHAAAAQVAAVRAAAQAEAAAQSEAILNSARIEAESMMSAARSEAEKLVTSSRSESEAMLTIARTESEEMLTIARTEAETILSKARSESEAMLTAAHSEAEAQAQAEAILSAANFGAQAQVQADAILAAARSEADAILNAARSEAARGAALLEAARIAAQSETARAAAAKEEADRATAQAQAARAAAQTSAANTAAQTLPASRNQRTSSPVDISEFDDEFFEWLIALIVKPDDIRIIPSMPEPDSDIIYRLHIGSFKQIKNADRAERLLNAIGLTTGRELFNDFNRVYVVNVSSEDISFVIQKLGIVGFKTIWIRED